MSSEDAAKVRSIPGVSARSYGVVADGVTDDQQAVQLAINSVDPGGTVIFDGPIRIAEGPVTVDKSVTIQGGEWIAENGMALLVTSDDVTVQGVSVRGPGPDSPRNGVTPAILFRGRSGQYISGAKILGNRVADHQDHAIRLNFVADFLVKGNEVEDFAYCGIGVYCGKFGRITGNTIKRAHQVEHVAYGIIATDNMNSIEHRSENILIAENHVESIPQWEGLDTHGGKNISFVNNQVKDCLYGVMMTPGSQGRNLTYEDCLVSGNLIQSSVSESRGIHLGAFPGQRNSAVVSNNVITGVTYPINTPNSSSFDPGATIIRNNISDTQMRHDDTFKRMPLAGFTRIQSGDSVVMFDTGWRDITEYATSAVSSASFSVRRTLDTLQIRGSFVFSTEGSGLASVIEGLPPGWRPDEQCLILARRGGNMEQNYMNWNSSGIQWRSRMSISGSTAGQVTDAHFTSTACTIFATVPAPSAIPNTQIGKAL